MTTKKSSHEKQYHDALRQRARAGDPMARGMLADERALKNLRKDIESQEKHLDDRIKEYHATAMQRRNTIE